MVNFIAIIVSVIFHALVLALALGSSGPEKLAKENPLQLKFKQLPIRKVGIEKKTDNNNILGKLSYGQSDLKRIDQQIKNKASALSKQEEKRIQEDVKKSSLGRNKIIQKQISKESFKSQNWTNELSHVQDASVSFIPPKGISPDQLNEFEKVFYAFYKRVAMQYINSVQISVRKRVNERPYVQGSLQKAQPQELRAVIRYDELGNAEIVKILHSSEDDDIHKIFEDALGKMDKIPNIVKDLKDEDGKYYAIFSLSINKRR